MSDLLERFNWESAKGQWDVAKGQRDWLANPYEEIVVQVDPVKEWKRNFPSDFSKYLPHDTKAITVDVVLGMRLTYAAYLLKEVVEIDPEKVGGVPVLTGTRFKIAQILAELADGKSISNLARTFHLEKEQISALLHGMAIYLDRSFAR